MRLIDADKIGLTDFDMFSIDSYKEALKMLINKINNAPTVEPGPEDIGPEDIAEPLEDVCECFPPQVQISNCHDCTFNIYPTNNKWVNGGGENE